METDASTVKLRITCPDPTCKKMKEISVPQTTLMETGSGIVTISISKDYICNHSFQVFVDQQGRIRGYKKPDFELTFDIEDDIDKIETDVTHEEDDRVLSGVRVVMGEELLLKTMRAALCGLPIYAITDIPSIRAIMGKFRNVLQPYTKEIIVCSLQEYNQKYSEQLSSSDYDTALVIAIDQHIIINQNFEKKYNQKHFSLERSILEIIKADQSDDTAIGELHALFDHILDTTAIMKKELQKDTITKTKDLEKSISKYISKKLVFDTDVLGYILKNRMDFDLDEYFRKHSRSSEWGKGILDLTG
ncbi:MAG: hypothetical protein ACFFCT_13170 [Candidatus Odinarchaeota archaeon]